MKDGNPHPDGDDSMVRDPNHDALLDLKKLAAMRQECGHNFLHVMQQLKSMPAAV